MSEQDDSAGKSALVEEWKYVITCGISAGFLFRYGLILHLGTTDLVAWGVPASILGFILGMIVFSIRPYWRSVIFVALGIGLADIATAFFD